MPEIFLNQANLIGRGAFSWVVSGTDNGCVYKLFKSHSHADYAGEDPVDDDRNIAVFNAELEAYAILQKHAALKKHAPAFFGKVRVAKVVNAEGSDLSGGFLLDCCLCLERVKGDARKFNEVLEAHDYLKRFEANLRAAGIAYTLDASVFSPEDEQGFKVIDFAVKDAANEYDIAKALG